MLMSTYVYIIFEISLSENVCITFAKFSAMSSNFTRAGKFVPHVVEMSTNFRRISQDAFEIFEKIYGYKITKLKMIFGKMPMTQSI